MTVVFFCFRFINGGKGYRQEDFACYLQSGKNFGPGSYLTIISLAYILILLSRMNQRLITRFEMAKIWSDLGFLKPVTSNGRQKETKKRQRRIGFIQTGAGAWVLPFVRHFEENAGGDEGNKCEVVCFDNYGHPKLCDYMDDQWLRLNLSLDGTLGSAGALKVFKTDFMTLDIPSHSLDVVVMPTGANLNIFRADKTIKTEEEREARLAQILSEIHRVLRPRGLLLSSTLFFSCPLWERAVARAGFSVPVQPEAPLPRWAALLPKRLRSSLLPDPSDEDGHGTGRKGWLPKRVFWAVLPARMHVAVATGGPPLPRSASEVGAAGGGGSDVIPDAVAAAAFEEVVDKEGLEEGAEGEEQEEPELPTHGPIVYTSSLADREELDFFPPGLQFRVAEGLILVNVLSWLGLVFFVWLDLREMQVPAFLPFTRQVCSFFIDIVAFLPMVIYVNAEELRDRAKTRGMLVPVTVLRNAVVRKWLSQRFTFLLSALFILVTWAPYLALDSLLIKVLGKSASEARQVDWAVSLVIALFFIVGGPGIGSWLMRHFKEQQEKEDRAEQEDLARESVVSTSTAASSSRQQGCREVPLSDVESPLFKRVAQAAEKALEKTKELPRL